MARYLPSRSVLSSLRRVVVALLLIAAPALFADLRLPAAVAMLGLMRLMGVVLLVRACAGLVGLTSPSAGERD